MHIWCECIGTEVLELYILLIDKLNINNSMLVDQN